MGRGRNWDEYFGYDKALDAAHRKGIKGITTEFVQLPTKENGGLTIIQATVIGKDGEEYKSIGDSSAHDSSLSSNTKPHFIRMAETRAKGRALRDYVNKGSDPELSE